MNNDPVTILLAEDSLTQAAIVIRMLEAMGYRVEHGVDGRDAFERALASRPALVITDALMPRMDGFEFCRSLRAEADLHDVPVVFLTSLSGPSDILLALESGADAFLNKPIREDELDRCITRLLASRATPESDEDSEPIALDIAGKHYKLTAGREQILSFLLSAYDVAIRNANNAARATTELQQLNARLEQMVEERTRALHEEIEERLQTERRLRSVLEGTISAMSITTELRDPYTAGHQKRVSRLACRIAEELGWDQERIVLLRMAGLIHDIGKVALPAEILVKPTRLTEIEYRMIKTHSQAAYDVVHVTGLDPVIAQAVLQHHERLNGSGYPGALVGADILPEACVLAVADVVEAMASHRPYRKAIGLEKALEEIASNSGSLYDPSVAEACISVCSRAGFDMQTLV